MPIYLDANNEDWKKSFQFVTQLSENGNSACLVQHKECIFLFTVVSANFSKNEIEVEIGDLLRTDLVNFSDLHFLPIDFAEIQDLSENIIAELDNNVLCYADVTQWIKPDLEISIRARKIAKPLANVTYGFLSKAGLEAELLEIELEEKYSSLVLFNCEDDYESLSSGAPIMDRDGNWVGITLVGLQGPGLLFGFLSESLLNIMDGMIADEIDSDSFKSKSIADFLEEAKPAMVEMWEEESAVEELLEETAAEVDEDFVRYKVFYGTNRLLGETKPDGSVIYTNKRDRELHIGICEVSIPKKHKLGEIERPGWFRNLFFGESKKKDFTILYNEKMEREKFLKLLNEKIGDSEEGELLLFIHGFNVDYDAAMMNAAQLGFDLNFKGGVTAFSWPSLGTVPGYVADTATARASAIYLADFIEMAGSNAKKMHIIAHSMGNVVLTDALVILKNENRLPTIPINEIILAAPDLDKDIFVQQIIPQIKDIARFTLYASSKDKALVASRTMRAGYNRLGEGGEYITVVDGVESIDASDVDTSLLGHGYFADTLSLIHDIHQVLLGELPHQRILIEHQHFVQGELRKYWAFKRT